MTSLHDREVRALVVYIAMIAVVGCILVVAALSYHGRTNEPEGNLPPASDQTR